MTRQTDIQITTQDIDLGASYMVITGRQPEVVHYPGDELTSIEMVNDSVTRGLILTYTSGQLALNIKKFSACRAWLYRRIKGVAA